jgi:peptidase E
LLAGVQRLPYTCDRMDMHLFSTPGPGMSVDWALEACREIIGSKKEARVAYLPQATLQTQRWLEQTKRSFGKLAQVDMIDTETMETAEMEGVIRRASLAYIPGGNTFLLNHRLHTSRLSRYLGQTIRSGLPVVAFSAGAAICGPDILTSDDLNMVPTPHFDGMALIPFNVHVHYQDDAARDAWLAEYHTFHDNPVLMLADGAYIRTKGKTTTLMRGEAWCRRAGQDKERLTPGEAIPVN